MAWDVIACATATYYLIQASRVQGVLRFSKLGRYIFRDGLLYFLVVFLVNLWVVLEFAKVFSSGAASSLPLAIVLIGACSAEMGPMFLKPHCSYSASRP
ncbi:hypothetical protein B0H19DRAFT_1102443 [Mycena capillaripes]|nr:hypothetical protein B0H19DRAFT_1102443 [Mycena capillaripes]